MFHLCFAEDCLVNYATFSSGQIHLSHFYIIPVQDGLLVQINKTVGGEGGLEISLSFHLLPGYPSCPPGISVTSPGLSRTQCLHIRQKLMDQAAALPAEPMLHRLVEGVQVIMGPPHPVTVS